MSCSMQPFSLRISTPQQEGMMRTSKWLVHQVLLDTEEMRNLFAHLGDFSIFVVSEVVSKESYQISQEDFLRSYQRYVDDLKQGKLPDEATFRKVFSSVFTVSSDLLYAMQVGENRFLLKTIKPVIQLQPHSFAKSSVDGKFYPMTQGKDSITWGIQFSYPQIYQKPKEHSYEKVVISEHFPNSALFQKLVLWLRKNTLPTAFVEGNKKIAIPIRIGKKVFPWIASHPQLASQGITIFEPIGRKV